MAGRESGSFVAILSGFVTVAVWSGGGFFLISFLVSRILVVWRRLWNGDEGSG